LSPPFFFPPIMVPTYLEQLIHQGRAEFKSYSGFASENHIIKVPESTYIIIYEYWYKPQWELDGTAFSDGETAPETFNYQDMVSYAHFFTGNKYHPFFHKPQIINSQYVSNGTTNPEKSGLINVGFSGINTDYRSCYIGSSKDVSVYFTRLINANVVYTPATIGPINSYQSNLGYAGQPVSARIVRFNAGTSTHYGPLQQPYSQIGGLTSIDFNQAFTIPNGSGNIENPETITGSTCQKSNRQLFFHCNYIQVNEPAPKTLI